jgi:hypothetical protein
MHWDLLVPAILRGNAPPSADSVSPRRLQPGGTQSVPGGIPTRSVGTSFSRCGVNDYAEIGIAGSPEGVGPAGRRPQPPLPPWAEPGWLGSEPASAGAAPSELPTGAGSPKRVRPRTIERPGSAGGSDLGSGNGDSSSLALEEDLDSQDDHARRNEPLEHARFCEPPGQVFSHAVELPHQLREGTLEAFQVGG